MLLGLGLILGSCKKDEKPTYVKDENGQQTAVQVQNTAAKNAATQSLTSATPTPVAVGGGGLNPAHGQPGHRCEIPVGQPLNSAPQAAPQVVTTNNNVPNAVQIDPKSMEVANFEKPKKTAPGMNPPHGEPGHRCDIAVGEPLNSKPKAATPNNIQVNPQPAPQPAPAPEKTVAMGEKPKMNPAHGQPFHDCAIEVGKPLP